MNEKSMELKRDEQNLLPEGAPLNDLRKGFRDHCSEMAKELLSIFNHCCPINNDGITDK